MSQLTICDGCGKDLKPGSGDHAITGERANDLAGAGLPVGRFDWCLGCAQRAFAVVKNRLAA